MMSGTAVVLAGSRPGVDAFASAHGVPVKALIPVGGQPMVRRPVDALLASGRFARIMVLAQDTKVLRPALPDREEVLLAQSKGTIAETMEALCDSDPEWPILVTTADHALLTANIVEEFLDLSKGAGLAIGMVERGVLRKRFADAKRTWLKFRGGAYSGANLFLLGGPEVRPALHLWRAVEQDRKKVGKLLWGIGPLTFLAAALRLSSVDQVVGRIGARLGLEIRAVRLSDPVAAVDVDKQADLDLANEILEGRA